ncbi:MAG TPA: penicillin-binding protein 2, partial [Acidobacteriota bacterium]|nr:penicillin-binding protein 2 [Acidobacteriota bacterium]
MLSQQRQAERDFIDRRINVIFRLLILVFIVFFTGFWYLQVIRGSYYEQLARENIIKEYPVPAPRGLILDRNNNVLAENRLSHNLFLTPRLSKNLSNTLQFLSRVLNVTTEDLVRALRKEGSIS